MFKKIKDGIKTFINAPDGSVAMYRRLLRYIKPYWKHMAWAFVFTLGLIVVPAALPVLIKFLTDYVLSPASFMKTKAEKIHFLSLIVITYFLITILKGYFTYHQSYLLNYGGQRALKKIRDSFFDKLQRMPMSFFSKWRVGELYSRGSNDVALIINFYTNIIYITQHILTIAFYLGIMLYMDWKMSLILFLTSPLVGITVWKFSKYVEKATHKMQSNVADLSTIIYDNLTNIKVVKSFVCEKYETNKFVNKNEENFVSQMKLVQFSATQGPIIELLAGVGFVIIVILGALSVINGKMSFGDIMCYWGFMMLMTNPINQLTGLITMFQTARAAATRVFEIMDTPAETVDEAGKPDIPAIKGNIHIENVTFAYEQDRPVLNNINLNIKEGQVVALAGKNGSGKSTLVSLITRFYAPSSGKIKIDSSGINSVNLKSLRSQIGLVPQETLLFSGTVGENIRYGKLGAVQEEIEEAARRACAHDFIVNMEKGYDTEVGDRGMKLSGGQRQRIVIARALLKNPKILILDEFTSGIDSESENLINEAIEELMKGRTCIVIAHRLSTIKNADKIVMMEDGKIVEEGTYGELIANKAQFFKMSEAQVFNLETV